jgi:hypothetical protein
VVSGDSWSPSVTVAPGGEYQLFYDAHDEGDGEQCIGRATASSPLGPFVDSSSTPFLCQQVLGGSIDASVFQWHGGDVLVWKSDRIAGIWAQHLGLDVPCVVGARRHLSTQLVISLPVLVVLVLLGPPPPVLPSVGPLALHLRLVHDSVADAHAKIPPFSLK